VDGNLVALVLGELAFLAFVLWLAVPFLRERARLRAELLRGIVGRFATAGDFVSFLETEPGRRLEASICGRPLVPLLRVVGGVQAGLVVAALGLGLALASVLVKDSDLVVAAVVALALGAGFLGAAFASHRLCRLWGLVPEGRADVQARPRT
jgi:hypothetical protein